MDNNNVSLYMLHGILIQLYLDKDVNAPYMEQGLNFYLIQGQPEKFYPKTRVKSKFI